ncbi:MULTISPECIES: hypothetical protein [Gordonia]|uniref:hypothetical protein n=1 Tax=Gordonia TaxID=2053 RepID=UPI0021A65B4E|nr:hypothetical protein [Gordonia sp. p3-SID1431]MCT1356285.1 hypothetical protein [Gordonia sp. p3-SID1431]
MEAQEAGRELGPQKSRRSVRTIDPPPQAIDVTWRRLDDPATGELLFSNSVGNAGTTQDLYDQAWSKSRKVLIDDATGEGSSRAFTTCATPAPRQ